MVVALGRGSLLVGVTRHDDAPEVAGLPRVGGFLDPSPEAVLAVKPDLVIWMTDGAAYPAVRRIAELGVPVLALPIIGVTDALEAVRMVGAALGEPAAGERLARSLSDGVERVRRRAAELPRVRVLFVAGHEPLVLAGPGSFADELLRIAGGDNVAAGDRPWPVYPLEKAVAADPALVVDGAVAEPAEGMRRLAAIPAVRAGRVARLESDDILRPGPRMVRALGELFRVLHPGAGAP
jgi:iron complex transport system substrate-binding protein